MLSKILHHSVSHMTTMRIIYLHSYSDKIFEEIRSHIGAIIHEFHENTLKLFRSEVDTPFDIIDIFLVESIAEIYIMRMIFLS